MLPDIGAMRDAGRPCSTCYWMTGRPGTERVDPIAGDVCAIWRDNRERYGARKIKAALERRGVTASRRRIGGIMRERGMRARTRADDSNRARRGPTRPGPRTCRTRGSDGSTPPSDTGVRRNSPNRDSSSKKSSNTPLPIQGV